MAVLLWWRTHQRAPSPQVATAIARLRAATNAPTIVKGVEKSPARASPLPPDLSNLIALSSFIDSTAIAGLSDEQIARIEIALLTARRDTYRLLFESAQVTPLTAGCEVEIPAQGPEFAALKHEVYRAIEDIVGAERMSQLEKRALGPKFDAQFGYFGAYPTTIRLSFETPATAQRRAPRDLVTMEVHYRNVAFWGLGSGEIRSTNRLYLADIERDFFPVPPSEPRH